MKNNHNGNGALRVIAALSSFGVILAAYLSYAAIRHVPVPCTASGCEIVQTSKYAYIFGIPVAVFGIGFYVAVLLLCFWLVSQYSRKGLIALTLLAGWGVVFSLYLIYLEKFVIKAWCLWCLGSSALTVSIAFCVFLLWYKSKLSSRV